MIGAVLGSAAPFVHILYPKTAQEKIVLQQRYDKGEIGAEEYKKQKDILWEKYQFIGFKNFRRFLYAIGLPIALLSCSFIFMFLSSFIKDRFIKKGGYIMSGSFQAIAIYFILWTIWPFEKDKYDFEVSTYYKILIGSSILFSIGLFWVSKSIAYQKLEIRELISLTVALRRKLFKTLDKHETKSVAAMEKEKVDNTMYSTFEKIVD